MNDLDQAMKRYVSFSVSENPMYDWWGPITSLIWREVTGYHPIVISVEGHHRSERRSAIISNAYSELGIEPIRVRHRRGPKILTSKLARFYGFMAPGVEPEDIVMTADIDIWPINREWFYQHTTKDACFYYANAHGGKGYPTCYISAYPHAWRRIMATEEPDVPVGIDGCLEAMVERVKKRPFEQWRSDEAFMAERLTHFANEMGSRVQKVDREGAPPKDRLDRSTMRGGMPEDLSPYVDAHLPRAYGGEVTMPWFGQRVGDIANTLVPGLWDWMHNYVHLIRTAS